jgi:hypothetical protein
MILKMVWTSLWGCMIVLITAPKYKKSTSEPLNHHSWDTITQVLEWRPLIPTTDRILNYFIRLELKSMDIRGPVGDKEIKLGYDTTSAYHRLRIPSLYFTQLI